MYRVLLFVLMSFLVSFYSCEKKEDKVVIDDSPKLTDEQKAHKRINSWIWDEMDVYYLWREFMPSKSTSIYNPQTYFNSILYDTKDKWSYITENYKELVNSFQGIEKAAGYSLALYYKDQNSYEIVAFVEFVYPNTPASKAGMKRGDIIVEINGQVLNIDNYYELLFDTESQTIRLATLIAGEYEPYTGTFNVVTEEIRENPVVKDTVYTLSGKKIGYLAYVGFISNFNYALDSVFTRFKNAGVTELIVDLRYNPGGDLNAANYLCSSIAPASAVAAQSRLVNFNWNEELQSYIEAQGWTDNLYINMRNDTKINLDLSKVYFLTTGSSASASELAIIGLKPYMGVVTIGERTHGKYTASITIPDEDSIWAMQPIVIKYSNARGVTDFEDGFTPDFPVEDDLKYQLGDTRDPMIANAILQITGIETKSAKAEDPLRGMSYFRSAGRHPVINNGVLTLPDHMVPPFQ